MIEEEQKFDTASLVHLTLQNKNNLLDFLDYAYVLFSSVDDEEKTERIRGIIKNHEFNRAVNFISAIKEDVDNKMHYYNDDIGDRLDYNEEMESMLIDIKLELLEYIGELINELNQEEDYDI